jgi:hypothetical protein
MPQDVVYKRKAGVGRLHFLNVLSTRIQLTRFRYRFTAVTAIDL